MRKGKFSFLNFNRIQKVLTKKISKIWMFPNMFHVVKTKIAITESLVDPKSFTR